MDGWETTFILGPRPIFRDQLVVSGRETLLAWIIPQKIWHIPNMAVFKQNHLFQAIIFEYPAVSLLEGSHTHPL